MPVHLSHNFTLSELCVTSTGLPNTPTADEIECLRALVTEVLQPWRDASGPLRVTSGFRSAAVNGAVGGSRTSQHRRGEAADVIPGQGRAAAWRQLLGMMAGPAALPVDQAIIYEDEPHVHVSHTLRYPPRRQVLVHLRDGRYVDWHTAYNGILKAGG